MFILGAMFKYQLIALLCWCGSGTRAERQNLTIGYLVNVRPLGLGISGALTYGVEKINKNETLLPNHTLVIMWNDTAPDQMTGIRAFTDQWAKGAVAFFGPEDTCNVEAHVANAWDLPMISYKCTDTIQFPTFVRTFPQDKQVIKSVVALLRYYSWHKFTVVHEDIPRWQTVADSLVETAKAHNFTINGKILYEPNWRCCVHKKACCEPSAFGSLVEETYTKTRVYVFLGDAGDLVRFMKAMKNKELMKNGDYIVIYVDLEYSDKDPNRFLLESNEMSAYKNKTLELLKERSEIGRSLLVITPTTPNLSDKNYIDFVEKVRRYNAQPPFNFPEITINFRQMNKYVPMFACFLYDSVLLYAEALHEVLSNTSLNATAKNGSLIVSKIRGKRFDSIAGVSIQIDKKGEAEGNFSVLSFKVNYIAKHESTTVTGMVPVGIFYSKDKFLEFRLLPELAIEWLSAKPPADEPPCGFDGKKCEREPDKKREIASGVLGGLMVVVISAAVILYRNWKYEQEIAGLLWKLNIKEIETQNGYRESCISKMSIASQTSIESRMCGQAYIKTTGRYKGTTVAIKKFEFKKKIADIPRETKIEMKLMREIRQDNINPFIGSCLEPNHIYIITEYCSKGSLNDILNHEDVKLEPMVISSLIMDLIKGMTYLHNSDLKCHGNLKSSNCVVTSRWVLQVADFGLHDMRRQAQNNENKDEYEMNFVKLWTAPEVLRNPSKFPKGSQKSDVYSFAIILFEIFNGADQDPYPQLQSMTPREILAKVCSPADVNGEEFRPDLSFLQCQEYIINCMKDCWHEKPEGRPDFPHIRQRLKPMRQGMKPNMYDHMMSLMETYATNLEGLVSERTKLLLEEKKLTETLLHRMLPQSVATALLEGKLVIPETFDAVTIYFSDIVGFTNMSAESTPMEVVTFLNDLYTIFDNTISNYDVYKVETIGDAYMVVSGLPIRNDEKHAGQIASMALDLLAAVKNFCIPHRPNEILKLRIGIHTGSVVAGVVGKTMPRYCLFGDTVNTASRMESNGEALKIHISEQCKEALEELEGYIVEKRGTINIKGKGELTTYWLLDHVDEFSGAVKKKDAREMSPLFSGGRIMSVDMGQQPETFWKAYRGIPRACNQSTRSIQEFGDSKSRRTRNYSPVRQLSVYHSYLETENESSTRTNNNTVASESSGGSGETIPADERVVEPNTNTQNPTQSQQPTNHVSRKLINNNNVSERPQSVGDNSMAGGIMIPGADSATKTPMESAGDGSNCNGQVKNIVIDLNCESVEDETTHLLSVSEKDQLVDRNAIEIVQIVNTDSLMNEENDDRGDKTKRWRSCSEINVLPPRPRPKTLKNWLTGLFNNRESLGSIPRTTPIGDGESVV